MTQASASVCLLLVTALHSEVLGRIQGHLSQRLTRA